MGGLRWRGSAFASRIINVYGNIAQDKPPPVTGSYSGTVTTSSLVWIMQMAIPVLEFR
jgi:hypothetical protein